MPQHAPKTPLDFLWFSRNTSSYSHSLSRGTWAWRSGSPRPESPRSGQPFPWHPWFWPVTWALRTTAVFPSPVSSVCHSDVSHRQAASAVILTGRSGQWSWRASGGFPAPCPVGAASNRAVGTLMEQLLHYLLVEPFPCSPEVRT